jgi:hypothetical protein
LQQTQRVCERANSFVADDDLLIASKVLLSLCVSLCVSLSISFKRHFGASPFFALLVPFLFLSFLFTLVGFIARVLFCFDFGFALISCSTLVR